MKQTSEERLSECERVNRQLHQAVRMLRSQIRAFANPPYDLAEAKSMLASEPCGVGDFAREHGGIDL